jgi:hypothetical protein
LSEFASDELAGAESPLTPESPALVAKRTSFAGWYPPTAGGTICSFTRYRFRVPWGVWQSRQVVAQEPVLLSPVLWSTSVSLECVLIAF